MNDERDSQPLDDHVLATLRGTYRDDMTPGSADCPDDETLASLAIGDTAEATRSALADHVIECARCAESVRLLLDLHREASAPTRQSSVDERPTAEAAPTHPPHRSRSTAIRLALPLAALLAIAFGWTLMKPEPPFGTPPDSSTAAAPSRAATERSKPPRGAITPAHGAQLTTSPHTLTWTSESPATANERVRVRLFDAEGEPLWDSGPVDTTTIALPDAVRDVLDPGSYFWVVEPAFATGVGGERGPYWFEIGG